MDSEFYINKEEIEGISPLLQVFDMPLSLQFYRDKLGFALAESSGEGDDVNWAMLKINSSILMLNTAYEKPDRPVSPDPDRLKWHSDTTLYFGYPGIDALYNHFLSKGIDLEKPSITGYGWKALNIKDPDSYNLCFHWPVK